MFILGDMRRACRWRVHHHVFHKSPQCERGVKENTVATTIPYSVFGLDDFGNMA
jgi:hypothetical protein